MNTILTFQDFLAASDKEAFIISAIDEHKESELYAHAQKADKYYDGENMISGIAKTKIDLGSTKLDLAAIRTPSAIFKRLIIQLVQTVWAYGVQLDGNSEKKKLGKDFDYIASWISENAALHGVCYGFWNLDKVQMFTVLEYFPLRDEFTGDDKAGIRFWRIDDDKPMHIQFYELDGWTWFTLEPEKNTLSVYRKKQPYVRSVQRDDVFTEPKGDLNYQSLPIIAMHANKRHTSELTRPIYSKIDLMDFILSGFGDDVLRTKVIYWVLQGFGGTLDEFKAMLDKVNATGIVAVTEGETNVTPNVVDLPFGAISYALDKLEAGIYLDFMGLRLSEISGGSLTNVAIETAQENLNLKASDFEWQAFDFVRRILALQGTETENIKFKRRGIANKMEIMQMLTMCREDLDLQTALEKNPLVEPDEVALILQRKAAEDLGTSEEEEEPEAEDENTEPQEKTEEE